MSEQDIQRKIIAWLRKYRCHATKYIAGAYGTSGEPDVFASVKCFGDDPPIALYIEVKTATGRLSLIQKYKIAEMESQGHWVCVARSVEDVQVFLAGKGIFLGD